MGNCQYLRERLCIFSMSYLFIITMIDGSFIYGVFNM
jgi:hypothetical protein